MRKLSQRIAASLVLIAILFAGLEAMAKYAPALQSAPAAEPMYLDDPIMGARPNPRYSDHDTSGWRNAEALGQIDIIALGDSQTYGMGADRDHAWPQQLSVDLGRSVYQIAFGGYNPTTFVRLLPEVLEFFVLSGFVLAPQLLMCFEQPRHVSTFLQRRWMRTIPPYLLALVAMSLIAGQLGSDDFLRFAFYVQNLLR